MPLIIDGKLIRISVKEELVADANPFAAILRQFFTDDLKRKRITKEWKNDL